MLLRIGDFNAAADELNTVLRLDASNPGAHYGLGLICLQNGDLARAEAEFRRALDLKINFEPASISAKHWFGNTSGPSLARFWSRR